MDYDYWSSSRWGRLVRFGDRFEWGRVRVFPTKAAAFFAVGDGFRQLFRREFSEHAPTIPPETLRSSLNTSASMVRSFSLCAALTLR
jgi:hypothetical protein